jgi:diguanylate cyclase (GGDEF)-like protein/PAS domain S-box-containing protein
MLGSIFSEITFFCFVVYLGAGVYVLHANPKSRLNRLFSLVCFCFAIWTATFLLAHYFEQKEALWILYKVSGFGWILAPALLLHFFLVLSESESLLRKWWIFVLIYLPPLVMYYQAVVGILLVYDFQRINAGWIELVDLRRVWSFLYELYYIGFLSFGFAKVYQWGKRSNHPAKKSQAKIIIYSGIFALLLASVFNIILPGLNILAVPSSMGANLPIIWIISIIYAIIKHKLMAITPAVVADDVFANMTDALIIFDWSKRILAVNQSAITLFNKPESSLKERKITDLFPGEIVFQDMDSGTLTRESPIHNYELDYLPENGPHYALSVSASAAYDGYGCSMGGVVLIRDISALKIAEEKLKHMATHDSLTMLPNRLLLNDRLRQALSRAHRYHHQVAVMLLDLDDFKAVNDTLGHDAGDILLKAVAEILQKNMRDSDTVARLGGDEFILVATDLQNMENVGTVASRILQFLDIPLSINSHEIKVGASIGISVYPDDSENVEDLLKNADLAMYRAKKDGKNRFRFFSETVKYSVPADSSLEAALQKAVQNQEFELHYQPIYDLATGKITAVEALLRWRHDEKGLISPMTFIPTAEKSGLILPIGVWVLERVCEQCRAWQNEGLPLFPVAVNISCSQLTQLNLSDVIERLLKKFSLTADILQIEITESTAVSDIDKSRNILVRLSEMGVKCIIDDFGAGYSSLRWLKNLPAYALKIDQFFVQNMIDDPDATAIVAAIIALAHGLGLKVIAEGIETKEQLEGLRLIERHKLSSLCCDLAQGYLLSSPLSTQNFTELLKSGNTRF